jgi:D-alanine-D-alanine ligase
MRVAIVHNEVKDESSPDERDVLVQARSVSEALSELGHETLSLACDLDLSAVKRQLEEIMPDIVFNLVESLDGQGRLIHLFPALLDAMKMPYTGSCAEAVQTTSNKIMAKERMAAVKLPTPPWVGPYPGDMPPLYQYNPAANDFSDLKDLGTPLRWIAKSLWEHASIGLVEDVLFVAESPSHIKDILKARAPRLGGACFAEVFVEGREFNLSLLAGPDGPEVLPPAEIIFEGYDEGKLRIVDYRAKWEEDSYEYHHTPRCFDFPETDNKLLSELKQTAVRCWQVFGLGGYVRVDFRVDTHGRVWILEINTNPCLSPDAGYPAALAQAGISLAEAIERVLNNTFRKQQLIYDRNFFKEVVLPVRQTHISAQRKQDVEELVFRYEPVAADCETIRQLTENTGFFNPAEIDVAVELVQERLDKGADSGYYFVFAEQYGRVVGYASYGHIACTESSYDLYWIAVHPDFQGKGLGRKILEESERLIKNAGGTRIYVETSSRAQYAATRAFYEHCDYRLESLMDDFYAPGDAKAVYCKAV